MSFYNKSRFERVFKFDSFNSSIKYDTIITTKIQSNQHSDNKDIQEGKGSGMVGDYNDIKKAKTIMVVDDDQDTTFTVKSTLELENSRTNDRTFFQVYTYNFPELALSEFKPNFYDLLLIDGQMPEMNGFELSAKILEIDADPKICFMSAAEVNFEALKEIYPTVSFGCFIKKPVSLDRLIKSVKAELAD